MLNINLTLGKSHFGLACFSPVFRPCFLWQLGMAFPKILPHSTDWAIETFLKV